MKKVVAIVLSVCLLVAFNGLSSPRKKSKKRKEHLLLWEKYIVREMRLCNVSPNEPLNKIFVRNDSNVRLNSLEEIIIAGLNSGALNKYDFDLQKLDSPDKFTPTASKHCKFYIYERWWFNNDDNKMQTDILALGLLDSTLPQKRSYKSINDTDQCFAFVNKPLFYIRFSELRELLNRNCQMEVKGKIIPVTQFFDERMFVSQIMCIAKTDSSILSKDGWVY